jgi:hypothetical protein
MESQLVCKIRYDLLVRRSGIVLVTQPSGLKICTEWSVRVIDSITAALARI